MATKIISTLSTLGPSWFDLKVPALRRVKLMQCMELYGQEANLSFKQLPPEKA